jgi:hypothetical protein
VTRKVTLLDKRKSSIRTEDGMRGSGFELQEKDIKETLELMLYIEGIVNHGAVSSKVVID